MSNIIRLVVNNYNEILEANKEIMIDSWPMMNSPGPMLCIVGTYLAFVLKSWTENDGKEAGIPIEKRADSLQRDPSAFQYLVDA